MKKKAAKRKNPGKTTTPSGRVVHTEDVVMEVEIVNHDPEDYIIRNVLGKERVVWSTKAASRELGMTREKIASTIAKCDVSAVKTLSYRKGELKVPGYKMEDIVRALMTLEREKGGSKRAALPSPDDGPNDVPPIMDDEARLMKAKADKAELDLAERMGVVHLEDDIIREVGYMIMNARAKIMAMPNKIAALLPVDMRAETESKIRDLTNDTLSEISEYRPNVHHDPVADVGSTADADGEPVGGSVS